MLIRFFVTVLILTGIHELGMGEDSAPELRSGENRVRMTGEQTLEFGPFELKGDKLQVEVNSDGQKSVQLSGNACLLCGKTRLMARSVRASWTDQSDVEFFLKEDVEIQNTAEQLRMYGRYAHLRHYQHGKEHGKHFYLMARDRDHVTMFRTSMQKTTVIKAFRIDGYLSDSHTLHVQPYDLVSINERPVRSIDRVEFETNTQSEFDFFDDLEITDFQILDTKKHLRRRPSTAKTELLQLLK